MHDSSIRTGDRWMKKHLDRYARWAKGHNSWLVVTFDENAGRTGNPIHTIIVGDHVRSSVCPEDQRLHAAPHHRGRHAAAASPLSKICVNYLGHQGTNEVAGVPTDQDASPADSVADALEASSAVVWRQAAIDLGSAGVFNARAPRIHPGQARTPLMKRHHERQLALGVR
jgi:hypothetical protein